MRSLSGIANQSRESGIYSRRSGARMSLQSRLVCSTLKSHLAMLLLMFHVQDGGTLAFPTPEEADHGKKPWPHVSYKEYSNFQPLLTSFLV